MSPASFSRRLTNDRCWLPLLAGRAYGVPPYLVLHNGYSMCAIDRGVLYYRLCAVLVGRDASRHLIWVGYIISSNATTASLTCDPYSARSKLSVVRVITNVLLDVVVFSSLFFLQVRCYFLGSTCKSHAPHPHHTTTWVHFSCTRDWYGG